MKKSLVSIGDFSKEEILKIVTIRYAMSANSYQKFIPTNVATDVNEKTVASILENIDFENPNYDGLTQYQRNMVEKFIMLVDMLEIYI